MAVQKSALRIVSCRCPSTWQPSICENAPPPEIRVVADVVFTLFLGLLHIHAADQGEPHDTKRERKRESGPRVTGPVDDDSTDDRPDPGRRVAHKRVDGEEADFSALGTDVAQHGGGES